jgi:predicted P-loop ATPase
VDIVNFMKQKVDLHYNVVIGAPEMRWKNPEYEGIASKHSINRRDWTRDIDGMVKSLLWMMEEECQLDASLEKMFQIIGSDRIPEFDPLVDYLHRLPAWNPETDPDYLHELAETVKILDTDPQAQDLWERCLKKWFVWMIVGWIRPRDVNQSILYLIGAQGTYKSTWMRSIMPPELGEYFKVKQDCGAIRTDDLINMSRFGLILHEEVDTMTARENNTLKAMSTTLFSDERAPYARSTSRRINGASLCATGNNECFLTNDQGTRRSLVFRVESIVSPLDHPFNYEGIYSQGYYLAQHGFPYFFNHEEEAELGRHNLQFETVNMEEEAASLWLRHPEGWETPRWFRAGQIADLLSSRSQCHFKYDANKISSIMKRLGFECTKRNGFWGYKVMVRDYDEAVRYQKELAMAKEGEEEESEKADEVKDMQEAPEQVQDMYDRLLGETDDEAF